MCHSMSLDLYTSQSIQNMEPAFSSSQLSADARERLKVLADATCINFEKLKIIKQEIDIPFYEPSEEWL